MASAEFGGITLEDIVFIYLTLSLIRSTAMIGLGAFFGLTSVISGLRQEEYQMGGDPDEIFHR